MPLRRSQVQWCSHQETQSEVAGMTYGESATDMQTLLDERAIVGGLGRFARILDEPEWLVLGEVFADDVSFGIWRNRWTQHTSLRGSYRWHTSKSSSSAIAPSQCATSQRIRKFPLARSTTGTRTSSACSLPASI